MKSFFKNIFKGKLVIIGVGNTLRGDDGFGPALIERLKKEIEKKGDRQLMSVPLLIDTGSAPENYAGKIAKEKPDTILIVDAIDLGLKSGEYEILKKTDIAETGFTTHNMSLNMFIEFLEKETEANIFILGVQPENVNFAVEMSECLKENIIEISDMIIEAICL